MTMLLIMSAISSMAWVGYNAFHYPSQEKICSFKPLFLIQEMTV
jgi:hypothetical protein